MFLPRGNVRHGPCAKQFNNPKCGYTTTRTLFDFAGANIFNLCSQFFMVGLRAPTVCAPLTSIQDPLELSR